MIVTLDTGIVSDITNAAKAMGDKYVGSNDKWRKGHFSEPWHTFVPGLAGEFAFYIAMTHQQHDFPAPDTSVVRAGCTTEFDFKYRGKKVDVKTTSSHDGDLLVKKSSADKGLFDIAVFCSIDFSSFSSSDSIDVDIIGCEAVETIRDWMVVPGRGNWLNYEGRRDTIPAITLLTEKSNEQQ